MTIGEKEMAQIRQIAHKLLMSQHGSIYTPIERDKLLFQALNEWLKQKGITCEWNIHE